MTISPLGQNRAESITLQKEKERALQICWIKPSSTNILQKNWHGLFQMLHGPSVFSVTINSNLVSTKHNINAINLSTIPVWLSKHTAHAPGCWCGRAAVRVGSEPRAQQTKNKTFCAQKKKKEFVASDRFPMLISGFPLLIRRHGKHGA